jgi:hypothetical protein
MASNFKARAMSDRNESLWRGVTDIHAAHPRWAELGNDAGPSTHSTPAPISGQSLSVPTPPDPRPPEPLKRHPLRPHSLKGAAEELRKQAQEQTPLLGSVCVAGQATVWYAKPNTGKTLIALALLRAAVTEGRIQGDDVYYVDADDDSVGIVDKLEILEPYGVHILCPGLREFEAKKLANLMREMIEDGTAKGTFLILDTLKKFVSLMDKREASAFATLARQFVMKGGTLLALAHTNKQLGANGKPVFAGTSDIVDDFDCSFIIAELPQQADNGEKVVQFDNIKRRGGDVAQKAAYAYATFPGISYLELMNSVALVDGGRLEKLAQDASLANDLPIVEAIEECIEQGIDSKIAITRSVAISQKIGQHSVGRIIDRYTGNEYGRHRWSFIRGAHGKQHFHRLRPPGPKPEEVFDA